MRALAGVLLPALLAGFVNAHAPDRAQISTAAIAAQSPCQFTTFEEQTPFTRRFYSKAEYDGAKTNAATECLRIQYLSDGLKVVGFLVKPRDPEGRRYPVIIYNRGGLQEIGKIDTPNILDFYEPAANGFVVLASQYRGNDGGEGLEELGGIYDLQGLMEPTRQRMPGVANRVMKLIPDYSSRGAAALAERPGVRLSIDSPRIARAAGGAAGQSQRHASALPSCLYEIRTGITLSLSASAASARIGHQS